MGGREGRRKKGKKEECRLGPVERKKGGKEKKERKKKKKKKKKKEKKKKEKKRGLMGLKLDLDFCFVFN